MNVPANLAARGARAIRRRRSASVSVQRVCRTCALLSETRSAVEYGIQSTMNMRRSQGDTPLWWMWREVFVPIAWGSDWMSSIARTVEACPTLEGKDRLLLTRSVYVYAASLLPPPVASPDYLPKRLVNSIPMKRGSPGSRRDTPTVRKALAPT
jgi:hypothetical protein